MKPLATGRQRKVLRLLGIPFGERLSRGAAGWEIANLFADPANLERWDKYLFLTQDLTDGSDNLMPFDEDALGKLVLPSDWNARAAIRAASEDLVGAVLCDSSPFDNPEPFLVLDGAKVCFTGKFDFGTRSACQVAAEALAAKTVAEVTADLDYLVVGQQGSPTWKKGAYGSKIEKAVLLRRRYGLPAIVSEKHWVSFVSPSQEAPRTPH